MKRESMTDGSTSENRDGDPRTGTSTQSEVPTSEQEVRDKPDRVQDLEMLGLRSAPERRGVESSRTGFALFPKEWVGPSDRSVLFCRLPRASSG